MNPQLTDLVAKAKAALAGKASWGHTLCVDFGADGVLYVYANNAVAAIPNSNVQADCTLHLNGIATLNDMLSKKETPTEEWFSGNLTWDGDRSIAEQFVALIQSAKA